MKFSKEDRRAKIHRRVRKDVKGTPERPRISIFRSNNFIYAQVIDDRAGHTVASANSKDNKLEGTKGEQARQVGKLLAEKAQAAGVESVVFDRSGYLYHGRVKALAEGAREGGLKF